MGQVTPEHETIFQQLLKTVDNAGARATLTHVFEVIKDVAGVALPVVEAEVPAVGPVVAAVAQTVEDIDAQIQQLLAVKAQKMREAQGSAPVTGTATAS